MWLLQENFCYHQSICIKTVNSQYVAYIRMAVELVIITDHDVCLACIP